MNESTRKVYESRIARAERADRLAAAHGVGTVHGATFTAEAAAWRADAERAKAGDVGAPVSFLKLQAP